MIPKFRAWDKINKEIHNRVNVIVDENGLLEALIFKYEFNGHCFCELEITEQDNIYFYEGDELPYIVMQYTGLKDKNGAGIYEGDVLLNDVTIEQPEYLLTTKIIGDIQILKGMTYLVGKQWQYTGNEDMELKINDYKCLMLSPVMFEVIGNIYENPELLEVAE